MATIALTLLLLATFVALGRPPAPLTARALPGAAARGVLALSRLSDRRRQRLAGAPHTAAPASPQPLARTPC